LRLPPPAAKEKTLAKSRPSGKINPMQPWKILTKLLLITLLALSASSVVSAKVASGLQNVGGAVHPGETVFNPLTHRAKIDVSTTLTPGSPVVAKSGVKFGQANVKSTFAHGPFAGRSIGDVASGLRSGKISPNDLPVEFVIRNGEKVALNNRSLTALRRAGMQPTKMINRTGSARHEKLLDQHLGGGSPSDFIRIRGGPPGTSNIQ